jgi:hypothetical protein
MISVFETYGVGWLDEKEGHHTGDLGVDGNRVLKLSLKK